MKNREIRTYFNKYQKIDRKHWNENYCSDNSELNDVQFGDWVLIQHIYKDSISKPILALFIGYDIVDMALEVVYIPGNHSRLTEAHIAYALSKTITDANVIWNVDYAERKVLTYGTTMVCLEHGDFNTNRSFFVFATEFAKQWGNTEHRVLYTGHFHKEKTVQYITRDETNGFTLKILPSLSKVDRYHQQGKWTMNKRGGIIELYSKTNGCTGNFSYYI